MNPILRKRIKVQFTFISLASLLVTFSCQGPNDSSKARHELMQYIDQIKVINTHEHQHSPDEFDLDTVRFYDILHKTYLFQDVISAGIEYTPVEANSALNIDPLWSVYGPPLEKCRATSYYGHFIKGLQKLYDFKDPFFTQENVNALNKQIVENYMDFPAWLDKAFETANFELAFLDRYWNHLESDIDQEHYALVIHINGMVYDAGFKPVHGEVPRYVFQKAAEEGFGISSLDDYLSYCDHIIKTNVKKNAVTFKSSLAYSRSIEFEDVPYELACDLFEKDSQDLTTEERTKIQDFVFHWFMKRSVELQLPVQIHTGYLAGNGNKLYNSDPMLLLDLFQRYPDAKFSLFHGGYPWTSEFIALGKMFPNVYLDLVWLPQISREKAVLALDEMLDAVPYNKIFWGGDCAFIEEAVGSLEYGKSVVAETLSKRIDRGLLTMEVAKEIAEAIFRNNAIEVFKLEEKIPGLSL